MLNGGKKADTIVLIFSTFAVMVAATLTMATITGEESGSYKNSDVALTTPDPLKRAEMAAIAGIDEARYHIENHGRIKAGGLAPRFYINGATYSVEWDDVNMTDSTVEVRSRAGFSWGGGQNYRVEHEAKIKLRFLPKHQQDILSSYYSRNENTLEYSRN